MASSVLLGGAYLVAGGAAAWGLGKRLVTAELGSTLGARMDDANSFSFLSYGLGSVFGFIRCVLWLVMATQPMALASQYDTYVSGTGACILFTVCCYTGGVLFVSLVWIEMARSITKLNPNPSVLPGRRFSAVFLLVWFLCVVLVMILVPSPDNATVSGYLSIPFTFVVYGVFFVGSFRVTRLLVASPNTPWYSVYLAAPKSNVEAGFYSIRRTTGGVFFTFSLVVALSIAITQVNASYDWSELNVPGQLPVISVLELFLNVAFLLSATVVLHFLYGKLHKSIYLRRQSLLLRSSSKDEARSVGGGGGSALPGSPKRRVSHNALGSQHTPGGYPREASSGVTMDPSLHAATSTSNLVMASASVTASGSLAGSPRKSSPTHQTVYRPTSPSTTPNFRVVSTEARVMHHHQGDDEGSKEEGSSKETGGEESPVASSASARRRKVGRQGAAGPPPPAAAAAAVAEGGETGGDFDNTEGSKGTTAEYLSDDTGSKDAADNSKPVATAGSGSGSGSRALALT